MLNLNYNVIGGLSQKNSSNTDSRLFVNFFIPTIATLRANISATGSFTEPYSGFRYTSGSFTESTSSYRVYSIVAEESSTVNINVTGLNTWGTIYQSVPLNAQFSQSLVTMSLDVPAFSLKSYGFTTSSIISGSYGPTVKRGTYDNNIAVNIANPFIPVEYMLVGGGAGGDNLTASGNNGDGGLGGNITAGIFNLDVSNKNSITASVGIGGQGNPCPNPGTIQATSSSLWYRDSSNTLVQLSALGGNPCRVKEGLCGVILYEPFEWVDGELYGAAGAGQMSAASQSACNKPSSSIVPGNSGLGGNSAQNVFGDGFQTGSDGVVAIRIYDPKNDYSVQLSGSGIVSRSAAGYKYWYFVTQSNTIQFNIPTQSFTTTIDNSTMPSASAIPMDWLLVGGGGAGGNNIGGGGGGGQVLSGSYTIKENEFFNTNIIVGVGGAQRQLDQAQGFSGQPSVFTGTLQQRALPGVGGMGNVITLALNPSGISYHDINNDAPGGGSGGGGATNDDTTLPPGGWIYGFGGGTGSKDFERFLAGGGGGALQMGSNGFSPSPAGSHGGTGSLWLDGNRYGGGGGGGRNTSEVANQTIGLGGPGGGGNGGLTLYVVNTGTLPTTGSANTGGGGGGARWGIKEYGAAGGSGVAIFRMLTSDYNHLTASNYVSTSGSFDTYTSASYTFLRFKSDGNLTIFNSSL